jgi:branched-chain amino acid transport system ATP-binding protein
MIASALATKPKILLLDEPVGGLSPKEVSLFISLIKKINEILNITIVVIEHRMRVITEICHRLMVLNNGSVLCIGPPNEVIQNNEVINVYLGEKYARSQGN